EGATAYQVQGLETGEVMTIVESGPITSTAGSQPGTRLNAVATRIFHWASPNTPPAEAPLPPGEVVQKVSATTVPAAPAPSWTMPQGDCEPREGILSRLRSRTRGHEGISSSDPCGACPPCERQPAQVVQPCERQPAQVAQPCERQPVHVASHTSPYSPVPSEACCEPVNAQNDQVVPV